MRFLVLQHIDCEHPGLFRSFMARAGVAWDAVELDEGETIPEMADYDALIVMGGPMDVWDVEDNPWLVEEKRAIRQWVKHIGKPALGVCLGHQLFADSLNGACGPQKPAEVGVLDIELTEEGRGDRLFSGLPTTQKCLQWHGVRVTQLPEGGIVLARSDACPIQAMRIGDNVWSMQYHLELEPDTVANWARIPAYAQALEDVFGAGGAETLAADAAAHMADCNANAEKIFMRFLGVAAGTASGSA